MAARKKKTARKKKKGTWGGRRPGAGRPPGTGQGPSPNARRNLVAVMFRDSELRKLKAIARKDRLPVSTVAYRLIERALSRAR